MDTQRYNGEGASHDARPSALADRLPPQNVTAEMGVLGSVLTCPDVMTEVCDRIDPADFYRASHEVVWREMLAAHAAGLPCDAIVIGERLERSGALPGTDLLGLIGELATSVPHSANAAYYADIVREKAVARRLVDAYNEGLREVYSNRHTSGDLLESAERRVFAVADSAARGETVRVDSVIPGMLEEVDRRMAGEFLGLTCGIPDLDDVTCGFQPENLIYLAGRTSTGKTALALNVVDHLCVRSGRPALYVSLEMSRREIVERLAVSRSEVDGQRVRHGRLSGPERARLGEAAAAVGDAPLYIDDTAGRNVAQIAGNARRHVAREGVQILFVDLINRVSADAPRASRREEMGDMSFRLKGLARELKIPVFVLAQLNRETDKRQGNRPMKSDLKECGNLEEDADLVMLLHRPDYYDPNDQPGVAVVIVDKNRNGPTRDVKVCFRKNIMRFDSLAQDDFIPPAEF